MLELGHRVIVELNPNLEIEQQECKEDGMKEKGTLNVKAIHIYVSNDSSVTRLSPRHRHRSLFASLFPPNLFPFFSLVFSEPYFILYLKFKIVTIISI